jgi:hypothetical protein
VGNRVSGHQAAGSLGHEADDLVAVSTPFLEHGLDHRPCERLDRHGLEILDRGKIDQGWRVLSVEFGTQPDRKAIAPERVQVPPPGGVDSRAHLEPVWTDPVERSQEAVKTRQDPQPLLGPAQIFGAETASFQTFVDITGKGQHTGSSRCRIVSTSPLPVTRMIQCGKSRAQLHQLGELVGLAAFQASDQPLRFVDKVRFGGGDIGQGGFEVQRLGRGKHEHHGRGT